jgi:trigger factor
VIAEVIEQSQIKYPPQMLENEINEVIHQLEHRLQAQNLDLDTYLKTRGIALDELRAEAGPVAESRLKRSLVLLEISQEEGIEIEKEELQSETERTLEAMTRFMSETEMRKVASQDLIPNLVGNILADLRINRTLERLRGIAKGEAENAGPQITEDETGPVMESEAEPVVEEPGQSSAAPEESQSAPEAETQVSEEEKMDDALQSGESPGE